MGRTLELRQGLADLLVLCAARGIHILHFESQCYTSELAPLIQAIGKISFMFVWVSFCSLRPVPANEAFGHNDKWLPWWVRGLLLGL